MADPDFKGGTFYCGIKSAAKNNKAAAPVYELRSLFEGLCVALSLSVK
jgi:hypothetical protein